jgi:putative ABC transport system permease protein
MFRTNLKIAWRNLVKDKQFTLLNILGLSAGLACALLIFLWVNDELSFDKFLANDNRLYQLMERRTIDGDVHVSEESSGRLSEAVKLAMPNVEYAATVAPPGWFPQYTLSVNDKNIKASGQYVGKDYFNIFLFKLLEGNRSGVLENKTSIVISDELAQKLFGTTENIIGKAIRFQHDTTFYVSGVFEKPPVHSSQQFDFALSFDYFKTIKDWVTKWGNIGPLNYILVKNGTDINRFNKDIADIVTTNNGDSTRQVFATKFSDVYLHNNFGNNANGSGRIEYVKMFSLLAIFILLIACINFMNLSTAKASGRMKEVGIKKVVGAGRKQLIFQFLTESVLLTMFAMLFAFIIAWLLLPSFNHLTGKSIGLYISPKLMGAVIIIVLFTGFLAGSYPALYLSKFNPLTVLKGKLKNSAAEVISRKGLVVFQFTLSTVLIIAVIIIYQQVQFIQNTSPGYNKNNVIRIAAEGNIQNKEQSFIADIKQIPGVVNASSTFHNMVGHSYGDYGLEWEGKDPNSDVYFEGFGIDYDFIETMDMHMKEGRSFSKNYGADSLKIILNEAAVNVMHLKNPVGKTIERFGNKMQIIGVVKDFHFESLHDAIKPSYMFLQSGANTIVARISANNQKQTIADIQSIYKRYNPGFPFTFNFLDEAYQKQYNSEKRVSALSKYFAGLAIIISCLGLFGLAAFTAQKRRKEIGIRKVIGASVSRITAMLSADFLVLILIAMLIAFPIAWLAMHAWLQSFVYRINISAAVFFMAGISVMLITIITISFQAIKAAIANPVKSLRME